MASGGCAIGAFYSLAELNAAIAELLQRLNEERPLRRLGRTGDSCSKSSTGRRSSPCRSSLTSLPNGACAASASTITSRSSGTITAFPIASPALKSRHASPPDRRDFFKGERIAVHLRGSGNGKHTTITDHMPSSHRRYADWTIDRIRRDAALIGPATAALCDLILEQRPIPNRDSAPASAFSVWRGRSGSHALEAAATRAIAIGALTSGRSLHPRSQARSTRRGQRPADGVPILHPNIRGSRYYN